LKLEENNAYDEKKSVYALIYDSMKEEGEGEDWKQGNPEYKNEQMTLRFRNRSTDTSQGKENFPRGS
jgi:hypothetical protein